MIYKRPWKYTSSNSFLFYFQTISIIIVQNFRKEFQEIFTKIYELIFLHQIHNFRDYLEDITRITRESSDLIYHFQIVRFHFDHKNMNQKKLFINLLFRFNEFLQKETTFC